MAEREGAGGLREGLEEWGESTGQQFGSMGGEWIQNCSKTVECLFEAGEHGFIVTSSYLTVII